MSVRDSVSFTRRRLLGLAIAAACGRALLPVAGLLPSGLPAAGRAPRERPLAVAALYAPHDLAG